VAVLSRSCTVSGTVSGHRAQASGRLELNFWRLVAYLVQRCLQLAGRPGIHHLIHLQGQYSSSVVPRRNVHSIHPVLDILRPHRTTRNDSWKKRIKERKRAERAKRPPLRCKSIQSGTFYIPHCFDRMPLNERSFQDALRTFFQPIKNDDARLDFYAVYKKEAVEYDTDYVKKYDEDLNTTLIFVSRLYRSLLTAA